MGSRARLVAAVAVVSLALAGCEESTDGKDKSGESKAATASAESSTSAVAMPARGTCWAVPAASTTDPGYWFDDSAQVPCTEPHTSETALVLPLAEPTIEEAKRAADGCWNFVRVYIGIDPESWVPWGNAGYLPSKEEVADGASWLRCDAVFPETWDFAAARTTTVAAAGLADDPPADFWACLDEPPTRAKQPFVPCDHPHAFEETGTLAFLDGLSEYPAAAKLAVEARRQCRLAVPEGYEDVAVTASWDPRSVLEHGTSIAGPCFMFHPDGRPLPAR